MCKSPILLLAIYNITFRNYNIASSCVHICTSQVAGSCGAGITGSKNRINNTGLNYAQGQEVLHSQSYV